MYQAPARSVIEPNPKDCAVWHPNINDAASYAVALANQVNMASCGDGHALGIPEFNVLTSSHSGVALI
jgi:hypothetical protein